RVGNYPGMTVDRRSANIAVGNQRVELVDLPGTYSLTARSPEEQVAVDALIGRTDRPPDAAVVVVDATSLARGLYIVLQVAETGLPFVVALNMMDEAKRLGIRIDEAALAKSIGAPVVPIVAARGTGHQALVESIGAALELEPTGPEEEEEQEVDPALEDVVAAIPEPIASRSLAARQAYARWAVLSVGDDELAELPEALRTAALAASEGSPDVGKELIRARYQRIDAILQEAVTAATKTRTTTERLDKVLLHPVLGSLVFLLVMFGVFEALFAWSDPLIGWIEAGVGWSQGAATAAMPDGVLRGLVVDGIIGGVGNVIVFVPQIAILFLLIGILEDSGYLARVAFLIDRLMGGVGLHGKAFVPMLSGFACAIPAVMATRTIESRKDRLLTMMVVPLTSCSARLPVYVLVTAAVFGSSSTTLGLSTGALVLLSMYVLSIVAALIAAFVLRRTVLKGQRPTLVLELPPYRLPLPLNLLRNTWSRVKSFLIDAGTIILAFTIILWGLLTYPQSDAIVAEFDQERAAVSDDAPDRDEQMADIDGRQASAELEYSAAGRLGKAVEPLLEPFGQDWRVGIAIIGAFAAREVFVSTLGMVFGIEDADEENESLRELLKNASWPDGRPLFTPLSGLALLVFFVLACQCMSTLAVVKRESNSWRWPIFLFVYMSVFAYLAAVLVFQVGSAFGWGTS
ncbi:MAG: ferrous iron transport protein B, partial [Myxococcota bacterium]